MNDDFLAWQSAHCQKVEAFLDALFVAEKSASPKLNEAMRYALLGGGKRVRALLAFAVAELKDLPLEIPLIIGAAVECIHAYSLIHDDLPAMDNDDLRRGKPTCHIAFGEALALLAGDALQTKAFEILSTPHPAFSAADQNALIWMLARASGDSGMAGGQAIDLLSVGKRLTQVELEAMHRLKTGALIAASIDMTALCLNATREEVEALSNFAKHVGLLFQVVDDILDCTQDSETLGKTAGKDIADHKPTYVQLLGLTNARDYAGAIYKNALSAIQPFGQSAQHLRHLTDFLCHRAF